jgi:hypothetical protein
MAQNPFAKTFTADPRVEQHRNICSYLSDLYERKNHDYGDSFASGMREYGMVMPIIRMEDKLRRAKSLVNNRSNPLVKDESIRDTLLDLANYTIMTVIEIDGAPTDQPDMVMDDPAPEIPAPIEHSDEIPELMCVKCGARWFHADPIVTCLGNMTCDCGEDGWIIGTGEFMDADLLKPGNWGDSK